MVLNIVARDAPLAQIGRVEQTARIQVVVIAGLLLVGRPAPVGGVEPESVLPDRTAESGSDVVNQFFAGRRREAPGAQLVAEITILKTVARVIAEGGQLEGVATVLVDDVRDESSCLALGGDAAGLQCNFLRHQLVGLEPATPATAIAEYAE